MLFVFLMLMNQQDDRKFVELFGKLQKVCIKSCNNCLKTTVCTPFKRDAFFINHRRVHLFARLQNQYQKDLPPVTPKMMVEYTRQQEEEKLMNGIEEDHRKLQTAEDRELDVSLERTEKIAGLADSWGEG